MSRTETRTYRGSSLEELLPRILEELGEDAVVTRQRDGVVGGVGGFFGKRCVEVEARRGAVRATPRPETSRTEAPSSTGGPPPALAASSIVGMYDTGAPAATPIWAGSAEQPGAGHEERGQSRPIADDTAGRADTGPFVETLLEQSAPFAEHLASAQAGVPAQATPPAPTDERIPAHVMARVSMGESGLPAQLSDTLLREVVTHVEPFSQKMPLLDLLRRAVAREIHVRHGWWGPRRTIAIIGASGSGKTHIAARLCRAYAAETSLSVSAVSLEPARAGVELARLTEGFDINFALAETPAEVRGARRKLEAEELVVADTPAFDPSDPHSITRLECLLDALQPDETHLAVPASTGAREVKRLLDSVSESTACLVLSHVDHATSPPGAVVGHGITTGTPFSYVSSGSDLEETLQAADASVLAELVLP